MGVVTGAWRGLYPFAGRRLDLGGRAVHYLDEGQGETVLMVHGNPTWSFYFRELVKELRTTHRCLVPDHVGMGLSDRPAEDGYSYTLKTRVDDLEALVERVAPAGPVTLVVHDWGGMIGMGWAVRHPGRVKAIVAGNTACFRLPKEKPLPGGLKLLRGPLGASIRASGLVRRRILRSASARRLAPEVEAGYLEPLDGWDAARAARLFVSDIPLGPADPAWDELRRVEAGLPALAKVPLLLAWGMKDWVFDAEFLRGWTNRFPKARVLEYPDAGHLLLEDEPGAARAMAAFVREPGGA